MSSSLIVILPTPNSFYKTLQKNNLKKKNREREAMELEKEERSGKKCKRKSSSSDSALINDLDDGCLMHIFSFLSPIPGNLFFFFFSVLQNSISRVLPFFLFLFPKLSSNWTQQSLVLKIDLRNSKKKIKKLAFWRQLFVWLKIKRKNLTLCGAFFNPYFNDGIR